MAFAALARVLYRHRSAFRPFAVTAAAFILAAIIHRHHPGYWVIAAVVTAAAGGFLGMPHRLIWAQPGRDMRAGWITRAWEACGISRPAERAYVTAVAVTAGGWISAAIAIGPLTHPLPGIAAIATVILGIPWWAHRRRRARVRIERTMQAWPGMAGNMGPARLADHIGGRGRVGIHRTGDPAERYHGDTRREPGPGYRVRARRPAGQRPGNSGP
jgi:S-DNA-T family DNA segregation ATPase FtsK/SpoIIIE